MSGTTSTSPGTSVLPAAKRPVGTGSAPLAGMLAAVLVGALGVVGVQEALVRTGLVSGRSWISSVLTHLDGRTATFSMLVGFVALVLIGLWLLSLVLRPRPRTTVVVRAETGVHLRGRDLAKLAEPLVQGTDGVTDVHVRSTASELTVQVSTISPASDNPELNRRVRERLAPCLDALESKVKTRVDITNQDLT